MAFGLFRKRLPKSAAPAVEAKPAAAADIPAIGVTMREIDPPIRINGRHRGGLRAAYKP
jgi:hypothetical protein